jgi:hypothetical protein
MKNIRLVDDSEESAAAHLDLESVTGRHIALSAADDEAEQAKLFRASRIAKIGTGYIFSPSFFAGWVVVGIIWLMGSTLAVGVYPLWEGRSSLARNFGGIWKDITGRGGAKHAKAGFVVEGEKVVESGTQTPKEAEAETKAKDVEVK